MGVNQLTVLLLEVERRPRITVPALLQVGLEEQTLHLPAPVLLLGLNLVQGELQGAAGGQPGLEPPELDGGGRGRARSCGCGYHTPTVYLP